MKKPIFTGVCTALVTPFLGETLNTPMLRQLIRRQEQAGIDALVICGTTGESATLSDGEKTELFRVSREAIPENMAFLAGTGSNDTAHAVALSQAAEGCGAEGRGCRAHRPRRGRARRQVDSSGTAGRRPRPVQEPVPW